MDIINVLLMEVTDNGGEYVYMEAGEMWEISAPFTQLCCKAKTALKII
jgi:hypothetical protein